MLAVVGMLEPGREIRDLQGGADFDRRATRAALARWLFVTRERKWAPRTLFTPSTCTARRRASLTTAIGEWLPKYRRRVLPRFSIVTILYNKAAALRPVLNSYFSQSYEGEFEIVFVDDASPDDSVALVERVSPSASVRSARAAADLQGHSQPERTWVIAFPAISVSPPATGDIFVVIDADCMLNRHFLGRHAQAHSFGDTDVVIGPLNIETENEDPFECLERSRPSRSSPRAAASCRTSSIASSFLNCITRNCRFAET